MSDSQLVPQNNILPSLSEENEKNALAVVNYERVDASHYSFSYRFNKDVELRMDESNHNSNETDFVDIDYDERIIESERIYYSLAAASGILTGTVSMIHLKEEQIRKIEEFKEKDWKKIIITVANLTGYKKSDYKGASSHLVTRAIKTGEKDGKTKIIYTVLAKHPTVTGLAFSIINQFSEKAITLDENGKTGIENLPDYYVIGKTNGEKIVCAVLYWIFELALDEAQSNRHVLNEIGISKELIRIIKEFASFSFIKNISIDYQTAEKLFSEWISKIIERAEFYPAEDDQDQCNNPLIGLMRVVLNIAEDSFPVLINECIIRSMYILIRLCSEVKIRNISSLEELVDIPSDKLLPVDERILSRMCLVGSAAFTAVNIAGATLKAIKDKKAGNRQFSSTFFAELNIAGIGKFMFCCLADSKYWGEDIRILFQRKAKKPKEHSGFDTKEVEDGGVFESLYFDEIQTRILYCLESIAVKYDIARTENSGDAEKKELWLDSWKTILLNGMNITPDLANEYFLEDEEILYSGFYKLSKDKQYWRWFYLFTQEFALFKPYFSLGCKDDKLFKKLKMENDYLSNVFIRKQTIVSQAEVDTIIKSYSKYKGYISGSTKNKVIGIGVTAAAAAATGGVALAFAPGIAAAIAGEAVVGLHGAALTSASLAFVGGGALAAGGLGMAGGTAIITGGGALIGLVGSGTASAATIIMNTPSGYWVRQSAKLLTYSDCVLCNYMNDKGSVIEISKQVKTTICEIQKELNDLKAEKNELDKPLVKKTAEYLTYLKRCHDMLEVIAE